MPARFMPPTSRPRFGRTPRLFKTHGQEREPKAVQIFWHDFALTLSYLSIDFPRAYVSLIRTTNLLERFHKESRRKQKDIGMFQSETGCEILLVHGGDARDGKTACRSLGFG